MGERLTEAQRRFMVRLERLGGFASLTELGPQMTQEENSARQRCRRRGWVIFSAGYWRMTPAGRSLLKENPNG